MNTEPLTPDEKDWLKKIENLLENPPTNRIGFYATNDIVLNVYDRSQVSKINRLMSYSNNNFHQSVKQLKTDLGVIFSNCLIHSSEED
tara:strand:- start:399 stop:662 length:264 start_codon:yes stop_codon:yes gene_type:complete